MAGDIKLKYGTAASMTVTAINSLATSTTAGVTSDSINNTSTLATDYLVGGQFTMGTTPTAGRTFRVYAYSAFDTTPTWPDVFSSGTEGTAGAATVHDTEQLDSAFRLLWTAVVDASTGDVHAMPLTSIANAFGGSVPPYFALFFLNDTAVTMSASGHSFYYVPILYQYT